MCVQFLEVEQSGQTLPPPLRRLLQSESRNSEAGQHRRRGAPGVGVLTAGHPRLCPRTDPPAEQGRARQTNKMDVPAVEHRPRTPSQEGSGGTNKP